MRKQVIDASVAAKWVFPESGSAEAMAKLRSMVAGDLELLAPDSFVSEIGNIAWKKAVLRREVTIDEARDALVFIRSVLPTLVPSAELIEAAYELAALHRQTVYDCLYVALALAEECEFVTADQKLVRALEDHCDCVVGLL